MGEKGSTRIICASTLESEAWALHILGITRLVPRPGMRELREAVELNREGDRIISTFGDKSFDAIVGFIDQRGFSSHTHGMLSREIADHAGAFLRILPELVARHYGFVDKTIGDEVMIVLPLYGTDAQLAKGELPDRSPLIVEPAVLMADLLKSMKTASVDAGVVATFSPGTVTLAQVGDDNFSEWSCYGEPVHVARRLQETKPDRESANASTENWFALGAFSTGEGRSAYWSSQIEAFANMMDSVGGIDLSDRSVSKGNFKGVGDVTYIAGNPLLRSERG